MLEFIIKSTTSLFVIYLLYVILLVKENMHVFKRHYLLFGLLFSAIIPFIEFNMNSRISETIYPMINYQQINRIYHEPELLPQDKPEITFSIRWIVFAAYFFVFVLLLTRYMFNIFKLMRQKKNNPKYEFEGYSVSLISQPSPLYSFLNTIYMNEKDYENGTIRKEILIHELTHVRQRHSIDILLIELFQVVFWFNPLLWLYKREMKLNHEYIADSQVVKSEINVHDYQNFMLGVVLQNNSSFLASNYSYSFIKNRLIMLTKKKSLVRAWFKGSVLVSLIALLAIVLSGKVPDQGNETEWWKPILQKHNLKLGSYNNFDNVFEMATGGNSINNGICTLKVATVLIKPNEDSYMIIEADSVYHNIEKGFLEIMSGVVKSYKMGPDLTDPSTELMSSFIKMYLKEDKIIKNIKSFEN